ncbi:GDP/UDP-N,N'-diacetylbacillosamine 2-epimerase (hydrolysing) [Trichococcus flocculiformis]|uniref:UDP-N-acetylglucosamine 2-epimerase n=1 Tax=Trichococcus TaxID=82802 RepID=UPI0007A8B303|nr:MULTISPECIES: UDP-N-acetylglucosamine 2-epimerase [Trichococcus]CZR10830.1 udp-n-acetylglucosamine 2-epimerase [Trichococcus sp. ES5]SHG27359.1 GDP/UDP-N,N'-diacetylbacillosamine 2-epimerase (hydrolysing) [Trichococcus flocculiformis]
MKKICVITGTRAEYGLLMPLIRKIDEDPELELQLVATGMHLSPEFGMTVDLIERDGFSLTDKVEILLSSDTSIGISKSMGLAMISFSECFTRLQPDMIVVLGDRYEIFAAVSTAAVAKIPVAHLHGGETTEGAFDEAFRHSITKMSWLHFTSTETYRERVIQLGEDPERVFNVGAIGIENIKEMNLMTKEEIEKSIGIPIKKPFFLVTFHPVTLENQTSFIQFNSLLEALRDYPDGTIIFTKANSDTDGRIINKMIDEYVKNHPDHSLAFTSMGQLRYLSAMKIANAVIGNSSSGIIEAPSFGIPTVNIGDRQKGRIQASTVINSKTDTLAIKDAIAQALRQDSSLNPVNPYGNGEVSGKILAVIKKELKNPISLKKSFYDLNE